MGKRTTAWILVDALAAAGSSACLVGTGQTAWMQGARGIVLDSLVNDFVAGEIEHAVWSAWQEERPEVIVIEGQGSLLHPAYPGGAEILAAAQPDVVVLQHAPARTCYDGFSDLPIHPLQMQIRAVESLLGKPVAAITLCHEDLPLEDVPAVCRTLIEETDLPVTDVLVDGPLELLAVIEGEMDTVPDAVAGHVTTLAAPTSVAQEGGDHVRHS